MNKPRVIPFFNAGLSVLIFCFAGCTAGKALRSTQTSLPPTTAPTPLPIRSLDETVVKGWVIDDFDSVHRQTENDENQYLIFGNIPVSTPAANLSPDLAVFSGRWEGYSYNPPVAKDRKLVMVIQQITEQGGKAFVWSGTNLQFPDGVAEMDFKVVRGDTPSIEWQIHWPDGTVQVDTFTYDQVKGVIRGWSKIPAANTIYGPYEFQRGQDFFVYKDYPAYLEERQIYSKTFQNRELEAYGAGYLVYLPDGYETNPQKDWPTIFFLHGSGDRGDNVLALAKASPYMYIREKGALPFIIVAPLLKTSDALVSFPEAYMDGVLAEIQANYRVDDRQIYVTGLSIGGEATYRFALHRPDTFAAIAPLSAYLDNADPAMMKSIKDLPVWAIHGSEDLVFSVARAQQPVDALNAAGGNIRFTVLGGFDHDVWTHTYLDPKFYEWLLEHQKRD